MLRYVAILGTLMLINPMLTANSEPLPPKDISPGYETAYNQSELIASASTITPNSGRFSYTAYTHVTGYSSTEDQTDDTPFITASGSHVRHGVVAANWLPLGTKIKIPELFGDEVFTVEDRMHSRFSDRVDIWFPNRDSAQAIGKKYTKIIVL